ncbi:hypothetical protein MWU75_17050 [Ornithinimicrobium sp. F0845]|uniref:hypothetical protein n=1 Tax=Ornithinimicrobium sp. F0845 TaxID=2926412 RepID=UPI001FF6F110|nr:hypothetical protein [Ornithinimicrobium sp. F0845]MCK0113856.1 hypothetical protein [Ornithinimicrobium sp. F0845]
MPEDGPDAGVAAVLAATPWLGLNPEDVHVYRAILDAGDATDLPALGATTDLAQENIESAIDRLAQRGFISGRVPTSPGNAVRAFLHARMAEVHAETSELEHAAGRIDEVVTRLVGQLPEAVGADGVELVNGARAVGERATAVMSSARSEVLVLNAPPYAQLSTPEYADQAEDATPSDAPVSPDHPLKSAVNDVAGQALLRGVKVRHVIAQQGIDIPHRMAEMNELAALGLEVRVRPTLPTKMIVVDRVTAMVPPSALADPGSAALVISNGLLMNIFLPLFEEMWSSALPLGTDAERGPTEDERVLLGLLASGSKDEAIARQLDVHVHTARRRISALLQRLGTATRFQAGLQATRRGWL